MKTFTKSVLALIFILFAGTQLKAQDYYWVGGTGDWTDAPNHWVSTSGGTNFYTDPPGSNNSVYFDANSFLTANDTVYLDYMTYCGNFSVSGVLNVPTFSDKICVLLDVGGSFILDQNMNWSVSCELTLEGYQPGIINTGGIKIAGDMYAPLNNIGSYVLQSDLRCKSLTISAGSFQNPGHTITCDNTFSVNTAGLVSMGSGIVTAGGNMDIYSNTNHAPVFYSDSATFICNDFTAGRVYSFSFHKVVANNVISDNTTYDTLSCSYLDGVGCTVNYFIGNGQIFNQRSFNNPDHFVHFTVSDSLMIQGMNIIDTLTFTSPDAVLYLFDSDTLFINGEIIFRHTGSVFCDVGTSYIFKGGGTYCYDSLTIENTAVIGGARFYTGLNSLDNGGNSGWLFLGCGGTGGVWAGDVNNDLVVDNYDVLDIGVNYGQTGFARSDTSTDWMPKGSRNWNVFQTNGVDMKFADCNGSGLVDSSDIAAIYDNYGKSHILRRSEREKHFTAGSPALTLTILSDSVDAGSHVSIDISLGTALNPMDSTYGLAFSVSYDPLLINPDSLNFDFSGSWLGTPGSDMIGFIKSIPGAGRIDFALTRIDHHNVAGGNGHLLSLGLVTADNIPATSTLTFGVSDVGAVTNRDTLTTVDGVSDSTTVKPTILHTSMPALENDLHIYPNPADQSLYINAHDSYIRKIEIYDMKGQLVFVKNENIYASDIINFTTFSNGIYNVRCLTDKALLNKVVEVIHR